jgi:radical SAM superfamily enzyme YgiQ (UPF0313 family)
MAKVSLIALPSPFEAEPAMNPPLGLAYIAGAVLDAGHDVAVTDFATYTHDYTQPSYLDELPLDADVYGISAMSAQVRWLKQTLQHLKTKTTAKLVVGGPHASACPEECLEMGADHAVRGDGERVFCALVAGDEQSPVTTGYIENISALPWPARDLFDMHRYKRRVGIARGVHLITLRGCPYACAFCDKASVSRRVRYRTLQDVLAEVDHFLDRGVYGFVIYDDIFTLNHDRAFKFCREFKRRNIMWRGWSRANTLDEDILTAMRDSGMVSITMGIESGDDTVLDRINKRTSAADNYRALHLCKKLGVPVRCSLMYGNPGESRESIENTIRMIEETQPDEWNLAVLAPVPGSAIWERPEEYGIRLDKKAVRDADYVMTNRFGDSGIGTPYIGLEGMSDEQFRENLRYFVAELERVCPRRKIQDTIQTIDTRRV